MIAGGPAIGAAGHEAVMPELAPPGGQLHGVPIAVKELFDVENLPATYGSQARAGVVAAADSEVVRRLRRAGAVIVSLTRSHEFGWGITTQQPSGTGTRNPWNPDFISGGSSGGSAVAVAAGFVPAAVASDTGGSIRIPAALCGVAGIKPTFGRVPRDGSVALAPSVDTPGKGQCARYSSINVASPSPVDLYPTAMQYVRPAGVRPHETPLSVE